MSLRIAVSKGDGIGPEVIPEAQKILEHFLTYADFFEVELGLGKWEKTGSACSAEDIRELKGADAILFGAVTTPPDPNYRSVLLQIRHELDLYANLRPIRPLPSSGQGSPVDMMIVRENTEGLYSGIEEIGEERSTTLRVVTKAGSRRIAEKACSLVVERNPDHPLVIGYKGNVLKSDLLFRDTCQEVAESHGIQTKAVFIDALCLDVLQHPKNYDVIVTTNMFGDILSDVCGYLTGGLGMLPSANIGDVHAFFEPVHGSAPDIAGKGIANPVAAIRSAVMMLEYFGMKNEARLVESSIFDLISSGVSTPDLGGHESTSSFGTRLLTAVYKKEESKI